MDRIGVAYTSTTAKAHQPAPSPRPPTSQHRDATILAPPSRRNQDVATPRTLPNPHPRRQTPRRRRTPRPTPATIARQAAVYVLFDNPAERALLAHISPLDIIEVAARRLLADGRLFAAAHLAALAAPYRHHRKRTVVTDPAGLPIESASPTALGGFGGVEPEPLRPLQPTDPHDRTLVINRIPRGARKGKRSAG